MKMFNKIIMASEFDVNKLKAGDMTTRSGCDHRDYCMARMYSVDMQCCHNCKEHIPERLWREINKIK